VRTISWLLACLLGASQSAPRLRVDLVFDPAFSQRLVAAATAETSDIWRPYGVDVRAPKNADSRRADAVPLVVTIAQSPEDGLPVHTLASIQFVAGTPTSTIEVYPNAVDELIARSALNRGEIAWAAAVHEHFLGRAIGRALAHELGHYLLRSQRHSSGLMRERQAIDDLTSEERRCCVLSREDEARLGALLWPPAPVASPEGGSR